MLRIVLVEDDYQDRVKAESSLRKTIPELEVQCIDTESAFRNWLSQLDGPLPDLVVFDVRLPWTRPSPDMEPAPADYEGAENAGLRCYELLRNRAGGQRIPVIFLTQATVTVRDNASVLPKRERANLGELARHLLDVRERAR
jgi:CheY-like chemotaxis protein